jgi:hypothetical protein
MDESVRAEAESKPVGPVQITGGKELQKNLSNIADIYVKSPERVGKEIYITISRQRC